MNSELEKEKQENFWNFFGIVATLGLGIIIPIVGIIDNFTEWNKKKNFAKTTGIVIEIDTTHKFSGQYITIQFETENKNNIEHEIYLKDQKGAIFKNDTVGVLYNPENTKELYLTKFESNYSRNILRGFIALFVASILLYLAIINKDWILQFDGDTLFRGSS